MTSIEDFSLNLEKNESIANLGYPAKISHHELQDRFLAFVMKGTLFMLSTTFRLYRVLDTGALFIQKIVIKNKKFFPHSWKLEDFSSKL